MGIEMDHDDVAMDDSSADRSDGAGLSLSNTAMTIDPSVVASRILQSTSLQQQKQKETTDAQPNFPQVSALQATGGKSEYRRVRCPPHRYTPLREHWEQILTPLVEYLKLQVRFNTKSRSVEMKTSPHTVDTGALQKGADFVSAFMMGFEVQDAVALLRLDDLFVESFQVTDVKLLRGDHLSRAIGRIAGQDGKTRFAIENATRTRIVVADQRVHLLGSYANLRVARNAICDLILGAPPGKVYNSMRNVAKRMSERY
jgi:RNA-binding protein PNO1